jgi:hypothetical protein
MRTAARGEATSRSASTLPVAWCARAPPLRPWPPLAPFKKTGKAHCHNETSLNAAAGAQVNEDLSQKVVQRTLAYGVHFVMRVSE